MLFRSETSVRYSSHLLATESDCEHTGPNVSLQSAFGPHGVVSVLNSLLKGPPVKNLFVLSLGLVVALAVSSAATAEEAAKKQVKSGPQTGDSLGAFYVTKVAGAENDGIDEGQNLCYRCRNGKRPQVVVFTRSTNPKVAELVQKLDKAVAENESSQLRVFVNLLGEDKEELSDKAKKFAAKARAKNVPIVVPNEFENGPDNYGINEKADVTIMLASDLGVKASHAVRKASQLNVDSVIEDLSKILN